MDFPQDMSQCHIPGGAISWAELWLFISNRTLCSDDVAELMSIICCFQRHRPDLCSAVVVTHVASAFLLRMYRHGVRESSLPAFCPGGSTNPCYQFCWDQGSVTWRQHWSAPWWGAELPATAAGAPSVQGCSSAQLWLRGGKSRAEPPSRRGNESFHGPVSAHGPAQSLSPPGAASNRACSSGDWVFNMWQTSDQFPIPQPCLVSLLVTAEWLRSTLSIIQQTYQGVDQWKLALSKPALAVCLKNAKVEDIALPLIGRHCSQRYSFLSPLSIWNPLLLIDIQELCIKWDAQVSSCTPVGNCWLRALVLKHGWGSPNPYVWVFTPFKPFMRPGFQSGHNGTAFLFSGTAAAVSSAAVAVPCVHQLSLHCSLPTCKSGDVMVSPACTLLA